MAVKRARMMKFDGYLDLHPDQARWGHKFDYGSQGLILHYARKGKGKPVLLLHGWPGFWYDWRRVIPRLMKEAELIAPDLRGFGDSDKPDAPIHGLYSRSTLARDAVALLDRLGIAQAVVAGHDIGAAVAQELARKHPKRVRALVLFAPPYPGIGPRASEPRMQAEQWHLHFHNLPWADRLAGHSRETVRMYLSHFYHHWSGRKESVRPRELDAIVEMYSRPGAIRGSFSYHRTNAPLPSGARASAASSSPITQPTWVLWGELDPVTPASWSDRLQVHFKRLMQLKIVRGAGHFVPVEAPDEATAAIRRALASS